MQSRFKVQLNLRFVYDIGTLFGVGIMMHVACSFDKKKVYLFGPSSEIQAYFTDADSIGKNAFYKTKGLFEKLAVALAKKEFKGLRLQLWVEMNVVEMLKGIGVLTEHQKCATGVVKAIQRYFTHKEKPSS